MLTSRVGRDNNTALRELLARFGVDVEGTEKLEGLDKRFKELTEKAKELGEILGAGLLGEGFKRFVEGQVEAGVRLRTTAERLGVTSDELQKFEFAAKTVDVSVEEADVSLRYLNRSLGEAMVSGGAAAENFTRLGVSFKDAHGQMRPINDVIDDLADKFKALPSQAERTHYAMQLFGRSGTALLPLLQEGSEKFREALADYNELGGGMTEEFTAMSAKTELAINRMGFAFTGLKSRIAMEALPAIIGFSNKVAATVAKIIEYTKHTNTLKTGLMALSAGGVVAALMKLSHLFGLQGKGLMGVVQLLGKFARFAIPITVLYLIFDDLFTLFTGGHSLIGKLIDRFYGVGASAKFVETMREAWARFMDMLPPLIDMLSHGFMAILLSIIDVAKILGNTFVALVADIMGLGDALIQTFITAGKTIWAVGKGIGKVFDDLVHGHFGDMIVDAKGAWEEIKDVNQKGGQGIMNAFGAAGRVNSEMGGNIVDAFKDIGRVNMQQGGAMIAAGGRVADAWNKPMQHIEINNTISGVSDPKAAADHATKGTKKALKQVDIRNAHAAVSAGTD